MPEVAAAYLRAALDGAEDALFVVDAASMSYVSVNEAACRLTGLSHEQLMTTGPVGLWMGSGGKEIVLRQQYDALIAKSPQPEYQRSSVSRPDGRLVVVNRTRKALLVAGRWTVIARFQEVPDDQGETGRQDLAHLRSVLERSAEAITLVDYLTKRYIDVNQAACDMLGYTYEELMTRGPVLPDARAAENLSDLYSELVMRSPQPMTEEAGFRRRDGRTVVAQVTRHAIFADGRWVIFFTARDITRLKAMERDSEHFRAAMDQIDETFALVDPETLRFIDVNDAMCRRYGYSRDELLAGGSLLVNSTSAQVMRERNQHLIDSQSTERTEQLVRRKDGNTVWTEVSRRAIWSEDRWLIVATGRDISDRKRAQAEFARFRAVIDTAADSIVLIDAETCTYLDVNQTACTMLGYTREEHLRLKTWQVSATQSSPEDARQFYLNIIDRYPEVLVSEGTARRRDGTFIPKLYSRRALQVDGKWIVVVSGRDITERMVQQRTLEHFRAAMDQSQDILTLTDRETMRFIDVNQEGAVRSGLGRERFLKLDPWRCIANSTREDLERAHDAVIAAGPKGVKREMILHNTDGTTFAADVWETAVKIDGKWIIASTSRDITDRKRAEAELAKRMDDLSRSNHELEQFAYIASHDLSEPLRMISSYTNLLNRRYKDKLDEDGLEFMAFIVDGAKRMKLLIDDLLTFSRAGRPTKKPRELDMNSVLDDVLINLQQLIKDKSATIERVELPPVLGDRTSMIQLLQNLIGNALKFQSKGVLPVVQVGVRPDDALGWVFSVNDNGIGIAPEYYERVFIIFQRLHGRDSYEGTGLGLAICKKIVEHHGGRIWVESTPGQGSTFLFSVPKLAPSAAPTDD